ncbi:glutamyl-tRNA synthetase [Chloroherpeton thalassium ATCC 35110]|uniref:Glutamate--tRNA ligase n=1 Tax=Chloroherpeton thalassium (strain ATCC 35110 / GB-78) TaxID=517418 RepID=SYE_CHLT3|nr:glutamate--tRNA ligase [Chloroherpeton thalassium]B3QYR1.1 RecName: Full=Glutamate--tRNA ligase; AltName: Full=Glutamyl-tRNA synthetase; Short=GluRS [Chloroherpeton thalassium ATCC 35110]ACF15134.1 glutamyl-tRNA synthetase [Chloroherpeton thalassium ATCC 35110]
MSEQTIRTRFAPSPTGYLHVGGLRTALYNFLFAKKNGGQFLLRLEDTDRARLVEGAVENLLSSLEWAGIIPDESPKHGGDFGPYVQSERLDIYKQYVQQLLDEKKAYYCFATPDELEESRQLQIKQGVQPKYNRKWLPEDMGGSMPQSEIQKRLDAGEPCVIRMKIPDHTRIRHDDIIRGIVWFDSSTVDDQVLMKSDGFPTYHLASVVDDHLMNITHVIRGEEWLSSTPKHLLLYDFFGWEKPEFAHLPLLLNPDRSKLSKRQGDVAVEDYMAKGYSKDALVNFVALLGWNEGEGVEQEVYSMNELIEKFTLEKVGKSGAVFNVEKLNWIQKQHLKLVSHEDLAKQAKAILVEKLKERESMMPSEKITDDAYLLNVVELMHDRVNFVHEFVTFSEYFFFEPEAYEEAAIKKRWKENTNDLLSEFKGILAGLDNFNSAAIEEALAKYAELKGVKNAALIHPIRLAVSGVSFGPSLYHLMEVIGKEACLRRIERAVDKLDYQEA